MPRVTCRCGENVTIPAEPPERVVCPKCQAKIRVRRKEKVGDVDGFIRFNCPCGRRLKVRATGSPQAGKCPDCGRVVPVPTAQEAAVANPGPEVETQELSAEDLTRLDQWARERAAAATTGLHPTPAPAPPPPPVKLPATTKMEAGLRVCPNCKRPLHLSATTCRECGTPVPRR